MLMPDSQPSTNQPAEPTPTWTFSGGDSPETQATGETEAPQPGESIGWTASEFIAHSKTALWYIGLMLITVIAAGLSFVFSGDFFIVGVIVIISFLFGWTASRKPRELPYLIDFNGLTIDKKLYPFSGFKSFSIVNEGGVDAIWLMPLQRFAPGISIYFDPNDKDKIADILSEYLPIEERKPDLVDTLMHKIRF